LPIFCSQKSEKAWNVQFTIEAKSDATYYRGTLGHQQKQHKRSDKTQVLNPGLLAIPSAFGFARFVVVLSCLLPLVMAGMCGCGD
jgi:hypothetical protein